MTAEGHSKISKTMVILAWLGFFVDVGGGVRPVPGEAIKAE